MFGYYQNLQIYRVKTHQLTQCPAVTTCRRDIREPPHLESIDLDNVITREPFACCMDLWINEDFLS
jgi:hypothetical protein